MSTLIIGGGLSGLVHAHELAKTGEEVLVLEKGDSPGGAVRTIERNGYLLELGPNTVRPTETIFRLCRELGIEEEILLSDPKLPRFVERGGRLLRLPFPALGPASLLRVGAEVLVPRGVWDEDEPAFDWVSRRFGRKMAEHVFEPFVSGIFAGDARRLSMAAAFPKFSRGERDYGGVIRWTFRTRKSRPKPAARRPGAAERPRHAPAMARKARPFMRTPFP